MKGVVMGNDRLEGFFNDEDQHNKEGPEFQQIEMGLKVIDGMVVIAFRQPVKSIAFNRQQTIDFANLLMSAACKVK